MTNGFIYKIVFSNGKHYIGLTTTSLKQRTKEHKFCAKNGDTRCLYNALRKYDMVDTFELIEIDTAETLEELCEKEIGYIVEYNSYYVDSNGYNMTRGGEGINGYVFTEEDNKKNSERRKKYYEQHPEAGKEHSKRLIEHYNDPQARERVSIKAKSYHTLHPEAGKEHGEKLKELYKNNPEILQKMSESQKKYFEEHPEVREKMSEAKKKYYKEHPEEILRLGEISKKNWEDPEKRKELIEALNKHWENDEAREQMSQAKKKYFEEHPEARERASEISKKQWESPEARQQQSERTKEYYKKNPDAIQKNREAQKNRSSEWIYKKADTLGQNKPFDVFTIDGIFIKTFTYQFDAQEYLKKEYNITSKIAIGSVLSGKLGSSLGFTFKYK